MAKRIGALLAAVAMVLAALVVRNGFGDGDDPTAPDDGTGSQPDEVAGSLVCAQSLAAVCEAAGVDDARVETAGTTADRLLAAESAEALPGAWLVTSAWADLVAAERERLGRAPLFEVAGLPLASSQVTVVVWADRRDQLEGRCGAVDWRCLATNDGAPLAGGDLVRAGIPPVHTADGLVIAAHQAASLLDTTDFAANDFDAAFRSAAAALAAGQRTEPLAAIRTRGPGEQTAVGLLAADASSLSTTFGTLVAIEVPPATAAVVVLVVPAGASVDHDVRRALSDALSEAGWDPPRGPAGLPAGGVLAAIRTLWAESS